MPEVWLGANRRVFWIGAVLPALLGGIGLVLALGQIHFGDVGLSRTIGFCLGVFSLAAIANLAWQARRPRLAYEPGRMLVYLRAGGPIRVPIEFVEGFLLGQGPSFLPGKHREMQASTVVIRLAERAKEWERIDVKPSLGYWCGHYITLRGAWCEPLSVDLVNRLNARLAEVKQQLPNAEATL